MTLAEERLKVVQTGQDMPPNTRIFLTKITFNLIQ